IGLAEAASHAGSLTSAPKAAASGGANAAVSHAVDAAAGTTAAATEGGEVFYRTMRATPSAEPRATGRLSATAETFISPTQTFSEAYDGVLVQFRMQAGTTEQLASIGVRDASALSSATYPGMPLVGRGWTTGNAFFKAEGAQIN